MNNITFTWVYYLLYAPNQNHGCEDFVSLDLFFLKMKEEFDAIQSNAFVIWDSILGHIVGLV